MLTARTAILVSALLAAPGLARAGGEEYAPQIDKFLAGVKAGKSAEALEQLFSGNRWMKAETVQKLKTDVVGIEKMLGSFRTFEKLQEIKVGTRFVYVSYLVLYDRQPLRMEFKFVRPGDDWVILGFFLDDKLDEDVAKTAHEQLAGK